MYQVINYLAIFISIYREITCANSLVIWLDTLYSKNDITKCTIRQYQEYYLHSNLHIFSKKLHQMYIHFANKKSASHSCEPPRHIRRCESSKKSRSFHKNKRRIPAKTSLVYIRTPTNQYTAIEKKRYTQKRIAHSLVAHMPTIGGVQDCLSSLLRAHRAKHMCAHAATWSTPFHSHGSFRARRGGVSTSHYIMRSRYMAQTALVCVYI